MNHRTTAAALASCVLALAALTACGSGGSAAAREESSPSGTGTASPAAPTAATATAGDATGTPSPSAGTSKGATAKGTAPSSAASAAGGDRGQGAKAALPPRPDRDGEAAYVRALTAIDPDIVHDKEDEAVERGRAQCATIHDHPGDREKQIDAALRRFTSPGHPEGFDRTKVTRIVDAVHTNLCPDY